MSLDLSDPERPAVWVECGATNRALNAFLAEAGYQLPWNVVLETVRVAGAVSMGTHGSGRLTSTVGDLVLALDVIDGRGERRTLSEETVGEEVMSAARCGLGMFGVIARVKLRIEPAHRVLQIDRKLPIDAAFAELRELVLTKDSVELFWFPVNDWAWLRTFERTELPSTFSGHGFGFMAQNFLHMLAAGARPRADPAPHALPAARDLACSGAPTRSTTGAGSSSSATRASRSASRPTIASRTCARRSRTRGASSRSTRRGAATRSDLVLNYRFVGPSKALLSPAHGPGLSCYPDALCFGRTPDWEEFTGRLCAEWMRYPGALPHWAKELEHVPGISERARGHLGERLTRFVAAWRASGIDPDGVFVNDMARRTLLAEALEEPESVAASA